ncbi:MAG: DUF6288 domain-containing protein [Planctomycetota bacterium]|jgi:hypothetical protein
MRVLVVLLALALAGHADGWPFGGGAGPFGSKDLFNLGLLGAKAADADAAPPPDAPPRSGRRTVQLDRPAHDDGPRRFRIELLFPGGPAAQAGLKVGDLLVGVDSSSFKKGSLAPLAKALRKAEAGKGVVTLHVRRQGARGTLKVKVEIPARGKAAARPAQGQGRRDLIDAALEWLVRKQRPDGGFAETLSGRNGAVIQTALAGLAWLGGGSDLERGPHRPNLRRAADWLAQNVRELGGEVGAVRPGGPSWNQSNWGHAHAAIFLGELHARTPTRGDLETLTYCAERLVATQEKSGGWAHGPGGPNALGYLELNIVTGLALCGLGLARQSGFDVPEEALVRAEAYLKASGGGDGGVGYSDRPGQKGQGNIGRSAAAWLGYLSLGRGKSAWGKKMGGYVRRHAGEVLGGHASLMQHILLAGVAAHAQGGAARKDYWAAMERDLVLARAPDGSFQPRPWHESIGLQSNSDVTFGEVWTTAAWTIVLASEPSREGTVGYPAWLGKRR